MSKVVELFGRLAEGSNRARWTALLRGQRCPYHERVCIKVRKSTPEVSIGTCTVAHGKDDRPIVICPHRLLERRQIFLDTIHLLTLHQPGNELHVVPEISIPGGSVDYFVASTRRGKVVDFSGVELQTLDSTGTVWPERQRFLASVGLPALDGDVNSDKPFGMNWKMTAKTTLVQLHHKIETFEHAGKHLVLVLQDQLLQYMQREFSFSHIQDSRLGDSMHFHVYSLLRDASQERHSGLTLSLARRLSTDAAGIATAMRLQASASVEAEEIIRQLEAKISPTTRLSL